MQGPTKTGPRRAGSGRSSSGTRREGIPATHPPAARGQPPEPESHGSASLILPGPGIATHLESRQQKELNSVTLVTLATQVPRTGTGLHTAAAIFEKPRAEPRMPRNRHLSPAPVPNGPRALRLPRARPLTAAACSAGAGGPAKSPRAPCWAMRLCDPGKATHSFLLPSSHHPPSRQKKKASRSPGTQDSYGPPKCASSSIPGTRSPWPSPSTLGHHPPWPRTEKAGASLGTQTSSMNKEKNRSLEPLEQSHSSAGGSIYLKTASPPPEGFCLTFPFSSTF